LGVEYIERSESLSANEHDVASSPNLKDMHQREVLLIGDSSWHESECNLLDLEGVFLAKDCVTTSNLRETIMDDILGHDHVDLTMPYCLGNILVVMTIWKWPLAQTTMEGFSLKELLLSYNESYVLEGDVERMISVKIKNIALVKKNERRLCP